MDTPRDDALERARALLQAAQQKYYRRDDLHAWTPGGAAVASDALRFLFELMRSEPTDRADVVRRGAFRYSRTQDMERFRRAHDLITRSAPGPLDDPIYVAVLAYQAASFELGFRHLGGPDPIDDVLLGTIRNPDVNSFADTTSSDRYTIIALHTGLIDFMYEAAKVVTEAMNPQRVEGARVSASTDRETIRERLRTDPGPTERLYRTLEACFFNGYPRATWNETLRDEHGPLLSHLVGMAERWIIGHEYGHRYAARFRRAVRGWNEEFLADDLATIGTVLSAYEYDAVPPQTPLGGAIFALACLRIRQSAFSIIATGNLPQPSTLDESTHPTPRQRANRAVRCLRQFCDVTFRSPQDFDVSFALRDRPPEAHGFTAEHVRQSFAFALALEDAWALVLPRIVADHRRNRPPHPMWEELMPERNTREWRPPFITVAT